MSRVGLWEHKGTFLRGLEIISVLIVKKDINLKDFSIFGCGSAELANSCFYFQDFVLNMC